MAVVKYVRGDNWALKFQILDRDDIPFNLTGCTVYFTVKANLEDTDAEAKIQVTQTTHIDAANGETSIPLTSAQTNLVGEFYYDVCVITSGNTKYSIIRDKIIFIQDVTLL